VDKFVFSGSPEQLQVLLPFAEMMWQMLQNVQATGGGRESELSPKRKGKIKITLKFFGYTAENKQKKIEVGLRLMHDDPTVITLQRLQYLGERIHSKFDNWQHQTGKKLVSYTDWENGYQLQLQVPSLAEGRRITEQILDIQSHSVKDELLRLNQVADEEKRYPELPEKIPIAGQLVRPPQQRAVATVKFTQAIVKFPHIPEFHQLCDRSGNVIKNLDFLKNYDD
jgi:hypothetical protein